MASSEARLLLSVYPGEHPLKHLEHSMLRVLAAVAAFYVVPAWSQSIVDGSDRSIPADQRAKLIMSVNGNPDLGDRTQIRGLRPLRLNNGLYYCGQARVGAGGWSPFYYDTFSGVSSAGIRASAICE
jgi:hypothetical protein